MAAALGVAVLAFTLAGALVVGRRLRMLAAADAVTGSAPGLASPEALAPGLPAEPLVVVPRSRS